MTATLNSSSKAGTHEQPISRDVAPLHIRPDVEEYIKRFSEKYAKTLQALADH